MSPLRVVYISPLTEPPAFIRQRWETELRRIFGADVEIRLLSERHRTPDQLAHEVHLSTPDAVVIGSAAPDHRRALLNPANETLILHPVTERYRDHHGYPRDRTVWEHGGPCSQRTVKSPLNLTTQLHFK